MCRPRRRRRPHPDLRGHRRRRQVRQADRLHGGAEPRQRHRGRLRRRVGRGGPVPPVHPGRRRRRQAGRRAARSCSTAGATRTRTRRSTPSSGGRTAGSTAATASSRTAASASRARRTRTARRSTPASGAITRRSTCSRSSPTARATRGASTSTTHGQTSSSRRASSRTCWHIIQGGRYQRQAGQHFNPYTYDDIKTIADHRHYVGATPHGGNNRSDAAGGGHAHCGLMFYLGGTWPKEYRGKLFMGNIHGHRINVDVLTPKGSGYVARPQPGLPAGERRAGPISSTCSTARTATST